MSGDISLAYSISRNGELRRRLNEKYMGFTVGRTELGVKITLYDSTTGEILRVFSNPVSFLSEVSNYIDLPVEVCDYMNDMVGW